jgi:predicted metal-dependent peptidase
MSAAVDMSTVEYNLEDDIFRLLREEAFFSAVSRMVHKQVNYGVPTAGVTVSQDGHFTLLYNPAYLKSLTDTQRRGILKHEFYHLIFEHCTERNPDRESKRYSKIWNFATDLSINCHIADELPPGLLLPQLFGFPDGLSAEEYLKLLNEKYPPDENGDGTEGMEGMGQQADSHDGWGDGDGTGDSAGEEGRSLARERLREGLRQAVNAAQKQSTGFGNMPADVRERIMRFINGGVNWKAVLRAFIGQSQRSNRSNSIKRINRRFPYIHAGRKTDRAAHIAIAIDQSGSVDDELLGLFFAELNNLSKLATFTVVPFDTRTDDKLVYQWKKGQKHQVERVMCGGTDFDAPTEWANKHPEIDGLIVLTDMQAPAPKSCRVRRLWMTDESGKESPYFKTNELIVAIKRNKR